MAGTKKGANAARATNYAKYGKDFYKTIGAKGDKNGRTGGFFANRELARIAGARGGRASRPGYHLVKQTETSLHYVHTASGHVDIVPEQNKSDDVEQVA